MNVIKVDNSALGFGNENGRRDSDMNNVHYWQLEIGDDKRVKKEIGFNQNDKPVVYFPNKDNPYGFFGDSPVSFEISEWETVDMFEFMSVWRELNG